jgi:hypothetical protein
MTVGTSPASSAYKAYVGAGAHATPPDVLALMTRLARWLRERGYTLRSGGSPGADAAFEAGCGAGAKEIYLPVAGFNGHPSSLVLTDELFRRITQHDVWQSLRGTLARESPPVALDALPALTRRLYARDVLQVLGPDLLSPAERVIFWRPSAPPEGTRITLAIAQRVGVATEDLSDPEVAAVWRLLLEEV